MRRPVPPPASAEAPSAVPADPPSAAPAEPPAASAEPPAASAPPAGSGGRFRFWLLVCAASVLVVGLAVGGLLVREKVGFVVDGDRSVEAATHRAVLSTPWLLDAARGVTHAGDPVTRWAVALAVVAVLAWRRRWRSTAFFATVVLGGQLLVTVVKAVVDRARPTLTDPVAHASGASFPSGHAMGSTILYGALVLLVAPLVSRPVRWALAAAALVLVAAICTSRVLLGVHYTSDVVGGFVFGAAWLALCVGAFDTTRAHAASPPAGRPYARMS